jgi:hypothetical protein
MTIVFRPEPHVMLPDRTATALRRDQAQAQTLGSGMKIVCSPWEGIYLEQAYSFMPGRPEDRPGNA